MISKEKLESYGSIVRIQKHQTDVAEQQVSNVNEQLTNLGESISELSKSTQSVLDKAQHLLNKYDVDFVIEECDEFLVQRDTVIGNDISAGLIQIQPIDYINITDAEDFFEYSIQSENYARRNNIDLTEDPFNHLMSDSQRINFEKWVKEEFAYKSANCDKYDYFIAATCGLIGGLIDILLVVAPGKGAIGKFTDEMTNKAVEKFAHLNGWKGAKEGKNSTQSAIGFLERMYKINYDHRHGGDVNGRFKMSTKNHHIKSIGHSPDLIGLFFSILNQFTSTASFISDGKLITIDTDSFELHGSNFVSKVFSGFMNWLGHLFSDMAGSSGAQGRGSGIPIPFYNLLQFINIGEFGQHKQTFATVAVQVFEQGYDLRHGASMAIPVAITEVLTRLMWCVKSRFYHQKEWAQCIPSASNPELRRMLLVAHGSLCLVDTVDASVRSGGTIIGFMLHANIIAWARFGTIAVKEIAVLYKSGSLDEDLVNQHLDSELKAMLENV